MHNTYILTVVANAGSANTVSMLPRPRPRRDPALSSGSVFRKGTNGVSTNGFTSLFMFFDRGTFGYSILYLPKSPRAYSERPDMTAYNRTSYDLAQHFMVRYDTW